MKNSILAPFVVCPILKTQLLLGKLFRDEQYGYTIVNFISSIYRCYVFENKTFFLSAVPAETVDFSVNVASISFMF